MNGSLIVVDDVPGEFAERVIEAFHGRPHDGFAPALSGGSTARACYERLADEAGTQIDWWKVDVYWGDERCVPLDDPESNYRLAREALLDRVGAANATFPMRCEEGADPYQLRIGELGRFDLIHLGLGPDGHTASLFPQSAGLDADPGRLVVLNDDPLGRNPHTRMTLTFGGIARARLAVVTVMGTDKHDALARVVAGDDVPASRINAEKVVWLVDPAAAGDLVPDDADPPLIDERIGGREVHGISTAADKVRRMTGEHVGAARPAAGPDVAELALPDLLAEARRIHDRRFGTRVTYSPKVFIPLTMLCRDRCGYCTFAQPPARLDSIYLDPDQVLAIARAGARAGCHEALFTLGERPEERYEPARAWLADHGYDSTVAYLAAMARLVLDEVGLLPHANAGALFADDLASLRPVSPSQGMMLESLNPDLEAHRGSPDKLPERRLATLEAAGELAIPFTTGILVGIGESRADRIVALQAIAESHRRWGHVQEVIVQNFLPKPGTTMFRSRPCPSDDYLDAIALARLILPDDIHLQAPPNLSDDFGLLLDAGIDDWGGVSPITADHVNPERPWPALDRLREVSDEHGFELAPRLTIYPEFVLDPQRWIDPELRFRVMDRADAEGLGRDDPGAVFVQRITPASPEQVDDGIEVLHIGPRSTAWYSGASVDPPALLPGRPRAGGAVAEVLAGALLGQEVGVDEIVTLFSARGREVAAVAEVADDLRRQVNGDVVTYVHNRNINYTNVCTFKCRFCGFSKGPLSLNLRGTPYLLTLDDIAARAVEASDLGATEVCLQGGIHPSFDGDYYIDVTRAVKDAVPDMHVHAFTALEVTEGAKRLGEPLPSYLARLRDVGLRTLPGTAAEILDDEIHAILCPDKIDTDEWLEAHRAAHSVGLNSNVTIMFGAVEQPVHWAHHMVRTRALQRETGGFTEFVPLPFVHMAAPIYLQRKSRRGPTFRETVLMHAVGRIAYHGAIDNIQCSWVKTGGAGVRQLLQAGVNDLGGTLMDENISRAAGASHGQGLEEDDFRALVEPLGRTLEQRTTLYDRPGPSRSAVVG